MADSLMYQTDGYVVLESGVEEVLLSESELLAKLSQIIDSQAEDLPSDLPQDGTVAVKARYLLENYCELDLGPANYLQWYAVRFEK